MTINDLGSANGTIKSWLDGDLVLEASGFEFRTVEDLQIDALHFCTFFGGGDSSWATTKDEHVYFDNFRIHEG